MSSLEIVLQAAGERAGALENLAKNPFSLLNPREPTANVDKFVEHQKKMADEIRKAIEDLRG